LTKGAVKLSADFSAYRYAESAGANLSPISKKGKITVYPATREDLQHTGLACQTREMLRWAELIDS
jgi:hypothetical protein